MSTSQSTRNRIKPLVAACALGIGLATQAQAGLVVSPNQSANTLINALLAGGSSGITFSNAMLLGAGSQNGLFSGGVSAGLGFDSGIVLSSGSVSSLPLASNGAGSGASTSVGTAGDPLLTALVGLPTFDAAVLSFDFVPTGNQVQFSYVFGSSEYNFYVNSSFNDVFGFFVNGVNQAVIPGTTTPVSINNVNCGQSSGAVSAGSPGNPPVTNCNLFVNNRNNDGSVGANELINLGGLTTTLSFVANVNPGVTNTLYLAIADASDRVLDSAVFLAGGTLSVCGGPGQPPCGGGGGGGTLPEPGSLALFGIAAAALVSATRRRNASTA